MEFFFFTSLLVERVSLQIFIYYGKFPIMLMLVLMLMSKCEPALMGTLKGPAISIVTKQKKISMWNYSTELDIL